MAVGEQNKNKQKILQRIKLCSQNNALSLNEGWRIAADFNCSLLDIETTALEHSIVPARFNRNSLSCHEQLRLFRSRVAIIGCGGLGGRTAELLARLGVGHLLLTDPDNFSESNLNRQIFCTLQTLGLNKVEVLASELKQINPVLICTQNIHLFNTHSITGNDLVIDGLDSKEARIRLSQLCQKQDIPMIHGAVQEWYGQAGIDQASNKLISTLYPQTTEPPKTPKVLAMSVALVASLQAAEAIKILLGHNSALQNSWLQTDLRHCEYNLIPLP
ncbi:HesA/MoeB/ThiF family protein [bacterium AH-315-P11]|nr:HesA/MoeB/ThiF family protein [bacterium AH-315-P11]